MSSVYIGIDPSLSHTGLVALDGTGKLGRYRAIKTKPVGNWIAQVHREQGVIHDIQEFIEGYRRDTTISAIRIMVEDYAPGKFIKTVIPSVELGGMLRGLLAYLINLAVPEITVTFVAPTVLKKFATGRGNADKLSVALALSKFGYDFGGDDNLFDAAGLARLGMAIDGHCDGLTRAQVEVSQRVK